MNLGNILAVWRMMNNLTLDEAAARIGIHRSSLHQIEQGKGLYGQNLAAIIRWLFSEDDEPKTKPAPKPPGKKKKDRLR